MIEFFWHLQINALTASKREADGRHCAIVVTQKKRRSWVALALEAPGPEPEQILAEHRHRLLGYFTTERKAKTAGERFLTEWAKGGSIAEVDCACHVEPTSRAA